MPGQAAEELANPINREWQRKLPSEASTQKEDFSRVLWRAFIVLLLDKEKEARAHLFPAK